MKFECIFAMFTANEHIHNIGMMSVFLYSYSKLFCKDIGYRFPLDTHILMFVFVRWREWRLDSLLFFTQISFRMPTNNEIREGKKCSNTRTTSSHETATSVATIQLQCSNPYSIPTFEDFLNQLHKEFEIEKNCKNQAYYFILSSNLFDEFAEFCKNYHSGDPHKDCLESLLSKAK